MTDVPLVELVSQRMRASGLAADPAVIEGCASYLSLLTRWNRRINLTSLPLGDRIESSTIDKLIVEPLIAASLFPSANPVWLDLGSGGGSPAIPMRLARRAGSLTMVESRERKCAFLREAVRVLGLDRTRALAARFDELAVDVRADVVTLRAVRVDSLLIELLARIVAPRGQLFCFGTSVVDDRFEGQSTTALPDGSTLFVLSRRE